MTTLQSAAGKIDKLAAQQQAELERIIDIFVRILPDSDLELILDDDDQSERGEWLCALCIDLEMGKRTAQETIEVYRRETDNY